MLATLAARYELYFMKVLNCNWVNLGPEIFEEKLPPPTHSRLNPAILTTFSSDEKCMSCVLLPTPAGAADIVDSNLKLILGLIWTLILHYQISKGLNFHEDSEKAQSPKQALLQYLNVSLLLFFTMYSSGSLYNIDLCG